MKFWKKALIISGTIVVLLGFGYFIEHAKEMSKNVPFEKIQNRTYKSSNKSYQIDIVNDSLIRFYSEKEYFIGKDIHYSDNLLTFMNDDEKYEFYVFGVDRLYFEKLHLYLFNYEVN